MQSAETDFNRQQVGLVSYPEGKLRPITADTNDYATLSVSSDGKTIADSDAAIVARRLCEFRSEGRLL